MFGQLKGLLLCLICNPGGRQPSQEVVAMEETVLYYPRVPSPHLRYIYEQRIRC